MAGTIEAGQWYASGVVWAAAGVGVAVVVGALTLWLTWRSDNPKRRLVYGMLATPLLDANAGRDVRQLLKVRYDGRALTNPHSLVIELVDQGRRDIPSSAFDGGQPLCLDVGASILTLHAATASGDAVPPVDVDGTVLEIGPALIKRRQTVRFSLLVDGPHGSPPELTCLPSPLIDIEVRQGVDSSSFTRRVGTVGIGVLMGLLAGLVANLLESRGG